MSNELLHVPGTVLGTGNMAVIKIARVPTLMGLTFQTTLAWVTTEPGGGSRFNHGLGTEGDAQSQVLREEMNHSWLREH